MHLVAADRATIANLQIGIFQLEFKQISSTMYKFKAVSWFAGKLG